MKVLKPIVAYLFWILMSWILGIAYMRILLGTNTFPDEGLGYLLHLFYHWGVVYVGSAIGLLTALLFLLLDIVYFKKKLKNNSHPTLIRWGVLLGILVFVMIAHFMLEKVINVI